jgi:hypothetical protein
MFGGGSEACTIMYSSSPDEAASPPGRGGSMDMDSSAPCNPVPEPSPERAQSLFDYESRVFALQRDLSSLLAMLESAPWEMAEDLRLTCVHDSHGLSDVCPVGFRSNPLAVITQKSGYVETPDLSLPFILTAEAFCVAYIPHSTPAGSSLD